VRLRSVEARGLRKRFAGFGISSLRPSRQPRVLEAGAAATAVVHGKNSVRRRHSPSFGRVRSRRLSVSVVLVLGLLGVAGPGCGASQGENTAVRTQARADPAQLALEINRSQALIDGASGSEASLQRATGSQQLAFRQLADHRALRRPTMRRLTHTARAAAMAALRATEPLSKIVPAAHRFPDWRILAPPTPRKLLTYFKAAATTYKIPWQYLAAIELVETRMGRIHGLSPAGAKGPMQFMPATWAEYGQGSINSQRDSIMAAARFLVANGAHHNMGRALLHYNPSQSYVVAVQSYAHEIRHDTHAFYAYYWWQVLYQTTRGTFLLPVGYPHVRPKRLPG
jgi:Transglycosylase SLT domain